MYSFKLAASTLAAALLIGPLNASAADLDHDRYSYRSDRYSSAYEDKRYRDIYGPAPTNAPPPHYTEPPRYYKTEPAPGFVPPGYVYRDRDDDLDEPIAPPRHYGHPHDRYSHSDRCLAHDDIRRRLVNEGWRDFRDIELRGDLVRIEARRRGELYRLKIDRCTGEVVHARPLDHHYRGPYAFEPGHDRPRRPYY